MGTGAKALCGGARWGPGILLGPACLPLIWVCLVCENSLSCILLLWGACFTSIKFLKTGWTWL